MRKNSDLFLSSPTQFAADNFDPKNKIILCGDATVSLITGAEGSEIVDKISENYIPQPERHVTNVFTSLFKKGGDVFRTFVDKSVIEKLKASGVKTSKIYLSTDAIVKYIKFSTFKSKGVIYFASHINENNTGGVFVVEEYRFTNGELGYCFEKRYDASIFATEIVKSLNDSLRSFSAEVSPKILVCGPARERLLEYIEDYNPSDKHDAIFNSFYRSSYRDKVESKDRLIPYLGVLALSSIVSILIALNGKANFEKTKQNYLRSVSGFEELYSRGRAPIELVENRSFYQREVASTRAQAYMLPSLVNAVGFTRSSHPGLNLIAEEIAYTTALDAQENREDDYRVVLRFKKLAAASPEDELKQWQSVFRTFSNAMKGQSSVKDTPIVMKFGQDEEYFLMTINGVFEDRQ